MRRLVAFASLVLTMVAIACGGGDDPTAPSAPTQPVATPQRLGPDLATASNGDGLSITTDKDDYSPGDTVWFTGAGWQPGDTLDIVLTDAPQTHDPHTWSILIGEDGTFRDSTYVVDLGDLGVTFTLTATGRMTGQSLTVTFTDNITSVSVKLNNTNVPPALVVAPNTVVSLTITANVRSGGGDPTSWKSTGWVLQTSTTAPTGKLANCVDTDNQAGTSGGGTETTRTFNIQAPSTPGTYNLFLALSDVDGTGATACGGGGASQRQGSNNVLTVPAPSNDPPTANPSGPYTTDEGSVKQLDGSGSSDPQDGTDVTYAWSVDFSGSTAPYVAIDAGGDCKFYATSDASDAGTATSALQKPYIKCTDDGVFKLTLVVTDKGSPALSSTPVATQLTVSNVKPTATFAAESPVNEGNSFTVELTNAVDPSSVDQAGLKYAFDCGDGAGYSGFGTSAERTCPTTDNGNRSVKGKVQDDDGGETEYTGSVSVDNVAPTATFNYPTANVPEGTSFTLSLTAPFDPSSADVNAGFRYAFDCGDPSAPVTVPVTYAAAGTATSATCGTTDNAVRTVKSRIFDKDDGYTTYTQTVTVVNVAPSVSITAPLNYSVWAITAIEFSNAGFVTAPFTDPGTADTHTCTIDWGEGTTNAGAVTESSGSGTCKSNAGNPYTTDGAGIYDITVTVKDDDQGEGTAAVTIVVFDPSAGFVTGGGWITSPRGACHTAACTYDTDGRANFGFVSKYQKGASVPTGQTEFQFQAGDLNFHSGVYEWLVVNQAGTNAQYKGVGTINGQACGADFQGKCRFMLWATDGTKTGGSDTFRISIWTENAGGTKSYIYDNGVDTPIGGGSIQVQTGKK